MAGARLSTIGAVCALISVAGFVVGIVLMASSGVQELIPETGKNGLEWLVDTQKGGDLFVAGATTVVFAGLVALGAFLGFYDALRKAGPVMVVAPAAGVAGMVTRHDLARNPDCDCSRSVARLQDGQRGCPQLARRHREYIRAVLSAAELLRRRPRLGRHDAALRDRGAEDVGGPALDLLGRHRRGRVRRVARSLVPDLGADRRSQHDRLLRLLRLLRGSRGRTPASP